MVTVDVDIMFDTEMCRREKSEGDAKEIFQNMIT